MTALVTDSLHLEGSTKHLDERTSSSKGGMPQRGQSEPQKPSLSEGDLRCGICNKSYSRRDLRDRHQRRCVKTAGQERQSKRRSCEICAQKKLRCSMTRPVCSRCSQMGISCRYPPSSIPPRVPVPQGVRSLVPSIPSSSAPAASSATVPGSLLPHPDFMVTDMAIGASTWAMESDDMQAELPTPATTDTQQLPYSSQQQNGTLGAFDTLSSTAWKPFISNMDFTREVGDSALPSSQGLPSFEWDDNFTALANPLNAEIASEPFGNPTDLRPHENLPSGSSAGETFTTPPFHSPSISPNGPQRDNATRVDAEDPAHMNSMRDDYSPRMTFAHDFTPKLGSLTPQEANNMYQDLFVALRGYPGLILEREFWSPFVHHQFYRCSLGGMAEPLGVALACVSAYASSNAVESSYAFVDRMINQEREKLVRNFQTYIDTPETCLAALHAVCVYQILGLFGDDFSPAPIIKPTSSEETEYWRRKESERTAELHSSFLLKMTRRLCNAQHEILYIHHQNETNWTRWRFTESLRRNVFFVNIINILSAKAQKFSGDYYEPLDDDMILTLPLPASESMWRAPSEVEWLVARERDLNPSSAMDYQTLRELLGLEKVGTLDMQALLPLTRMIFACARIRSNER